MKTRNIAVYALIFILFQQCDTALERDLRGHKVILLSPVNNVSSTEVHQIFYWETLNGAQKYQLQVVSPKFDSIVTLIADTTLINNRITILMPAGSFQWRVRGINNSTQSDFSDKWNLLIH